MSMNKTYAVFGLGKYGKAVAKELVSNGIDVIAVDNHRDIVNEAALEIPVCKCADVTDPEVIKQLDIKSVDVVIICMAESLEASVIAITLCKEAGVPKIIAKCSEELHKRIFKHVGADKVVFPEKESGTRLAQTLLSNGFLDVIGLSKNVSLVEIRVKPQWVGKSLAELNLRKKYSINVVAFIKDDTVITDIDPQAPLSDNITLVVIANRDKLSKL